jgi:hypothetical protein
MRKCEEYLEIEPRSRQVLRLTELKSVVGFLWSAHSLGYLVPIWEDITSASLIVAFRRQNEIISL